MNMKEKKFNELKFRRTYIGGSKKKENELFIFVQDEKNNYKSCDYVKYREMLMKQGNDLMNVLFSWQYILERLIHLFLITTLTIFFLNIIISLITLIISLIIGYVLYRIKNYSKKYMFIHDSAINILYDKIIVMYGR